MDGAPSLGALPAQDERFVLSERWMARATGILYSSGAIVAFLWTFLPDRDEAGGSVVAAMASIALVLGLSMALGAADKAPRPLFHVVVATIQVVISVGFVATQAPISSIGLFYIWATTYAWLLFGRGAAVVQTAWTGFCLAVALVVMQPALFAGVRVWMMVMATAVAMGLLVGIVADRMRRSQRQLSYAATHDPLTGLPNRAFFAEAVHRAAGRRRGSGVVYVLLVDLDHFKLVNDNYGHQLGDEILQVLASRLAAAVGPRDVVARMGGDEFAIVCEYRDGRSELSTLLSRLAAVWADPVSLGQGTISLSATIGVAAAGEQTVDSELLRWADVALYQGKNTDRGSVVFFDESLRVMVNRRGQLDQALRQALPRNELTVQYQAVVDLTSGRVRGAEALLRWEAGPLGEITPDEFIPAAEETGLIVHIGEWVLGTVTAQLAQWRRDGAVDDDFRVAVNVSVRQLTAGFAARVLHTLAEHGLPLSAIALEITESVLLDDSCRFGLVLAELRHSRIRLILDDFGKGYSSISYLQQLPLHAMKIDRSFVADLPASRMNLTLVTAVIAMAESLGMEVVAEGVENEQQADLLRALGAQQGQGYLFGRPMPAEEFLRTVGAVAHPEG